MNISASDAPMVTVDGKSEDSVTLSWKPPAYTYGTILKYQVRYVLLYSIISNTFYILVI